MTTSQLTPLQSKGFSSAPSPRRIRICHLSLGLATGGLERLLVDFARFHNRDLYEMQFVAMGDLGRPAAEIRESGCEVHSARTARGRWRQVKRLVELFRELRPDVVHTHNAHPHVNGTLAARWAGVPLVVHTRHGQRFGQAWRHRLEFRFAAMFVDKLVGVSKDAAYLTVRDDGQPASKVCCIWNGIDTEKFEYHGPARQTRAISVARLSPEKDFPGLLKAAQIACKQVPEFRLQIVGGGALQPSLEQLRDELNLREQVEFLGERADVPQLLADAGFFVTSSLTEGISLTLLEAMAVGLPVVATEVGGNPEIVVDGVTGRLVPPANPQALADAIVQMCARPADWPRYGESGRARVLELFDIRRMVGDYETLYKSLWLGLPSSKK